MMFGRLVWKLLRGSQGRLAVALIALVSGAAVISALLNLELDVEHKLTQEFRSLGANVVIASKQGVETFDGDAAADTPGLLNEGRVSKGLEAMSSPDIAGSAPYLYVVARTANVPVVAAGTWLDQIRALGPTWKLEGNWVNSRSDDSDCLVGRNVAQRFHLRPASQFDLSYLGRNVRLTVAGVLDAGGSEDNQVFVSLPVAQKLAATQDGIELWQLSVAGTTQAVATVVRRLESQFPDLDVRPIRQVTEAEGDLLNRIRLLIVGMALLIWVLTALCVLATMAALAMERREDVGLMKALGGSISRVVGLFLAEVGVLGAAGGLLGCAVGVALSMWMGRRVFGTAISPRWEIFPLTISLMVAVALAGALPLRLLGKVKPAVILRGA
jgi:putative ABC transport system permease protein